MSQYTYKELELQVKELKNILRGLLREIQFNGPTIKGGCIGERHPYQAALNRASLAIVDKNNP